MRVSIFFFLFNLIIFTSMFPSLTARETTFHYCKKANYAVKVNGLDIDPYPIARGKESTFKISATSGKGITKGKLVVDIAVSSLLILHETYDLCTDISCPVSSGDFMLFHKQTLPGYSPPGPYNQHIKLLGEDDEELSCIAFEFKVDFISAVADT